MINTLVVLIATATLVGLLGALVVETWNDGRPRCRHCGLIGQPDCPGVDPGEECPRCPGQVCLALMETHLRG